MSPDTIVQVFIPFTLFVITLAMGLGLQVSDFNQVFKDPRAVAVGVLSQLVLLPLLGFAMAAVMAPSPAMAVGLVLVAACPGGPSSNLFTNLAGGDTALSVSLTAISGIVTLFTIPWIANLAGSYFADGAASLTLPVGETALRLLMVVAVPLALGMLVRAKAPAKAIAAERYVKRAAVVLMAVLIVGALIKGQDRLAVFEASAMIPPILLNITGMIGGVIAAALLRLPPPQRIAIPIEVGTQNGALAIGLAIGVLGSDEAAFPGVVYGIFAYFSCAAAVVLGRLYLRKIGAPQSRV